MAFFADGLLIATCLTTAIYCYVLSRRLRQFSNTEEGVGKQVVDLNTALDETRTALKEAQSGAVGVSETLSREAASGRKLAIQLKKAIADAQAIRSEFDHRLRSASSCGNSAIPDNVAGPAVLPQGRLEAAPHADHDFDELAVGPDAAKSDDDPDPAELELAEMLGGAAGEQQLGFLPDESALPTEERDDPAPQHLDPTAEGKGENLLRVERMAL